MRYTRRRALTGAAALAAGVAGCTGGDGSTGGEDTDAAPANGATDTGDESTSSAAPDGERNLREANVVAVAVERSDDGHHFDVTLHHDDDGEDGYANWWQVETLGGERLGRRELAHAHGTREFTRSATVSVPEGTTCVVVRGHDRIHGYGGRVMVVNVETGATEAVRQGPARQSVAADGC